MIEFQNGETYKIDELPDNEMNNSGKLEWVGDNTLALATEGTMVEFEFSHVEATGVYEVTDDGELIEVDVNE